MRSTTFVARLTCARRVANTFAPILSHCVPNRSASHQTRRIHHIFAYSKGVASPPNQSSVFGIVLNIAYAAHAIRIDRDVVENFSFF